MNNVKLMYEQASLQAQLEMQEHTFNTISSEIHDNVGQVLSLAKVQLNILDQEGKLDRKLLADAKESVTKAMADLRDIAKSLNSERIQQYGLFENTRHELQRISRSGLMTTFIKSSGKEKSVAEGTKLILFRMIQEALQNIIKHSRAGKVHVFFEYGEEYIKVKIQDNGIGFNTSIQSDGDGLGLRNLVRRAKMINGEAIINSKPGEGTIITLISPYE
jgi:signal transduction histidine kinase